MGQKKIYEHTQEWKQSKPHRRDKINLTIYKDGKPINSER